MIIIAGPCQLESFQHGIDSALRLNEKLSKYNVDFYFKTSFDKANRTSGDSPRGAGIGVLKACFEDLKYYYGLKTLTDIHESSQVWELCDSCNTLQIPALLSRQTDLIKNAAATGNIVNIKKGQFMSPQDMKHAAAKAKGAKEVWLTERGTTFGYGNLVVDMRSLVIMKEENPNAKIIFDCTHSCQFPSASNGKSGGDSRFALPLAKAAIATGALDGLFFETHHDPSNAPSDGDVMIPWAKLDEFLEQTIGVQ